MTDEEKLEVINRHARQIGEHFTDVLILVSTNQGRDSVIMCAKHGNHCAQLGMAHDYICILKARTTKQAMEQTDEDGD